MKKERHKRKESCFVLIVSNLDRRSRQFRVPRIVFRLSAILSVLICCVMGGLVYYAAAGGNQAAKLREDVLSQQQAVRLLQAEKEQLSGEKQELEAEVAALREKLAQSREQGGAEEENALPDASVPSRYPSDGVGALIANYSEEHPYISVSTYAGGEIVASGNGVISEAGSDDTYQYIITIDHENGYTTQYLYGGPADLKIQEGEQVRSGDVLLVAASDGAVLDYQILNGGNPVDPFSVIDARG